MKHDVKSTFEAYVYDSVNNLILMFYLIKCTHSVVLKSLLQSNNSSTYETVLKNIVLVGTILSA